MLMPSVNEAMVLTKIMIGIVQRYPCSRARIDFKTRRPPLNKTAGRGHSEIDTAFATLAKEHSVPLVVSADALFTDRPARLIALAARYAIPPIYPYREFAAAGGLISYGSDIAEGYRQVGTYAGRILKGAKPADLPVQQVVKVELVINLNTAKTLGITVPLPLSGRADELIE